MPRLVQLQQAEKEKHEEALKAAEEAGVGLQECSGACHRIDFWAQYILFSAMYNFQHHAIRCNRVQSSQCAQAEQEAPPAPDPADLVVLAPGSHCLTQC